jgi:hypothetical protein
MTIDVEVVGGGTTEPGFAVDDYGPGPDEDDAELIALVRSRMLNFYVLQALPRDSLFVRPVGPALADRQPGQWRTANLVVPLEGDQSTRAERGELARDRAAYARRPPASRLDMLTGQVPGTDIVLGMSRRLFSACRSLAAEQDQLLRAVRDDLLDLSATTSKGFIGEEEFEVRLRERRAAFAERGADNRDHLYQTTREAYETGRESSWQQLIDVQPQLVIEPPANLLESATADTYLGIDASTATTAAQ